MRRMWSLFALRAMCGRAFRQKGDRGVNYGCRPNHMIGKAAQSAPEGAQR
jgi:hypothetical protein